MNSRNTFIPLEIQCFWCNGQMERRMLTFDTITCVTYFCKQCGGVSHFAVDEKQKIKSIKVEYESPD